MADDRFYVGETVVVAMRAYSVDPVTGDRTPEDSVSSVVMRFKDPSEEVLAERTMANAGVTNAGDGWYYASATPEVEGLHQVEMEVGAGENQGRDEIRFAVDPF